MIRRFRPFLAFLFVLAPGLTFGAEKWSLLRLGMTTKETLATLGRPTLRTANRGFEIWIYDNGAEALFVGSLIGWTSPALPAVAAHSVDIWQENQNPNKLYFPTFLARLPQPVTRRAIPLRDNGANRDRGDGYWAPFYLSR